MDSTKMVQCVGFKKTGERCTTMVLDETQYSRCGVHMKTLNSVGPNQIRRNELKYVHEMHSRNIYARARVILLDTTYVMTDYIRATRTRDAELREEHIQYQINLHALENQIQRETDINNGVDADEPYIARERARIRARRDAEIARRQHAFNNRVYQQQPRIVQEVVNHEHGDDLRALAIDRQNVHTRVIVEEVKRIILKVTQIPVPAEYATETLKTAGEIILECNLSPQAAWQMMAKYCADEEIYELGKGIYANVLNSVWQFIIASPHADDLKRILRAEMQDNVGMCSQGNLSRICNILSGYMEGLDMDATSTTEILGERLARLAEIKNVQDRLHAADAILQELNIPADQWLVWREAVVEA